MRALPTLVVSLLIIGSGCIGADKEKENESTATTSDSAAPTESATESPAVTATPTATGTSSPKPGQNQAPVAVLGVFLTDGTPLEPEDGAYEASSGVALSFDGSESSDPDGDELEYAWDFGDEQPESGATVERAFDAGSYTITLTVSDPEGLSDSASVDLVVTPVSTGPNYYFFDNADDAQQWTFASELVLNPGDPPGVTHTDQEHPLAVGWHVTEADKFSGGKSWTMQDEEAGGYHDSEYTHMTSADIDLTDAGTATLTFMVRGDSEKDFDVLYWLVSTDGGESWTELGSQSSAVAVWTQIQTDLTPHVGGPVQLRFLFHSDSACSTDTPLPANPVLACGAGEFLGYFVDDIKVA